MEGVYLYVLVVKVFDGGYSRIRRYALCAWGKLITLCDVTSLYSLSFIPAHSPKAVYLLSRYLLHIPNVNEDRGITLFQHNPCRNSLDVCGDNTISQL